MMSSIQPITASKEASVAEELEGEIQEKLTIPQQHNKASEAVKCFLYNSIDYRMIICICPLAHLRIWTLRIGVLRFWIFSKVLRKVPTHLELAKSSSSKSTMSTMFSAQDLPSTELYREHLTSSFLLAASCASPLILTFHSKRRPNIKM